MSSEDRGMFTYMYKGNIALAILNMMNPNKCL